MKYRCLIFFAILYVLVDAFIPVVHSPISIPIIGFITTSFLLLTFVLTLNDIIAEVYGMKISFQFFCAATMCKLIISLICLYLINLASPNPWHEQSSYHYIFDNLTYQILVANLISLICWYINTYFLTKWKILLHGKYFWLRSVCSSFMGQTIRFSLLTFINYKLGWLTFYSTLTEAMHRSAWLLFIELLLFALLAFPSAIIVALLKTIENLDEKNNKNINPFDSSQNIKINSNYQLHIDNTFK